METDLSLRRSASTVNPAKNPVRRPNTGSSLRASATTKRDHFLETDVTEGEHRAIVEYCVAKKISVSEFLSDLISEDAAESRARVEVVSFKAELKLTAQQHDKLQLLAHLRQKESVEELLQELIQPYLDLQRFHAPAQTKFLRVYLSAQEHERALKHLAGRGLPARKYVSFLAIRKLSREGKG